MRYLIILFLAGCSVARVYPDSVYQQRAAEIVHSYNASHGTHIEVPVVLEGFTQELDEGETHCNSNLVCTITLNIKLNESRHEPGYTLNVIVKHEVAHVICLSIGKCRVNDHGPEFDKVLGEL